MEAIVYRQMNAGEEQAVCDLVAQVFDEFVAADLEQRGIDEFYRFANPPAQHRSTSLCSSQPAYMCPPLGDQVGP